MKYAHDIITKPLTSLFNKIIQSKLIPTQWKQSDIIIMYKKGDGKDFNNYRPITFYSKIGIIFMKIIEKRLKNTITFNQPIEQAGFKSGYSTFDHLQTINQLIKKSCEYQIKVFLSFLDYKKAFDSIEHNYILRSMLL